MKLNKKVVTQSALKSRTGTKAGEFGLVTF
jgi:hypothetical protein